VTDTTIAALAGPVARGAAPAPGSGGPAPAEGFAALLERTLTQAVEAGQAGETASIEALAGRASLQDVVQAVNAAEITLQTVVAVRDRMIAAYQDILRMPI
jgi:flagellar hook-basal body complex protein FliE